MSYKKKIICLANSKKVSGRCIAGKEIVSEQYGQWIRPVSHRKEGEISEEEQVFSDGSYPQILDIISITLLKPLAHKYKYQTENHLIDSKVHWEKKDVEIWDNLEQIKDEPSELWFNEYSSSNGENDRIPKDEVSKLKTSLCLIYVQSIKIHVYTDSYRRKIRALFIYNKYKYNLSITDPKVESYFLKKQDGQYRMNNLYLCVSIGEPFQDYCYKLVASVITNPLF